jgi:hypothetical protein
VPCNREGKVAEPILNMTFAPDAPLAAREVRVRRVGGGMPRNGMPCAVARSVCCSRRAAMNGAFISMQPLSADYTTVEAVQRRAVFRSVRYYALRHGHFSDPYSVRVALDGTAEPRYKDQGSGLCRARGNWRGVAAALGGASSGRWHRSRAAPPTGPYERNRAERNQRATARRNANGSRNRGLPGPAARPPQPRTAEPAPNDDARRVRRRFISQVSHGTRRRGPPPGVYRREVQFLR